MLPNTKHTILFNGSFNYTRLPDGRLQLIVCTGDAVTMTTDSCEEERATSIHTDIMGCIVKRCDILSLVALKRTCSKWRQCVSSLSWSHWRALYQQLKEEWPFVDYAMNMLSKAKRRQLQGWEDEATYFANLLEHPKGKCTRYMKLYLTYEDGPVCKQLLAELREKMPASVFRVVERTDDTIVILDELGAKNKHSLSRRYKESGLEKRMQDRLKVHNTNHV
jgi:hypothetical protein